MAGFVGMGRWSCELFMAFVLEIIGFLLCCKIIFPILMGGFCYFRLFLSPKLGFGQVANSLVSQLLPFVFLCALFGFFRAGF